MCPQHHRGFFLCRVLQYTHTGVVRRDRTCERDAPRRSRHRRHTHANVRSKYEMWRVVPAMCGAAAHRATAVVATLMPWPRYTTTTCVPRRRPSSRWLCGVAKLLSCWGRKLEWYDGECSQIGRPPGVFQLPCAISGQRYPFGRLFPYRSHTVRRRRIVSTFSRRRRPWFPQGTRVERFPGLLKSASLTF